MANIEAKELAAARELLPIFKLVGDLYTFDDDVNKFIAANFTNHWFHYLLMGICSRESAFGLALSQNLTGDGGHGRGLMQIDDRSWRDWIENNDWKDPETNIEQGADIWIDNYNFFAGHFELVDQNYAKLIWAATAAYNCGAGNVKKALLAGDDVDARTTGRDYSADVRARAKFLSSLSLF